MTTLAEDKQKTESKKNRTMEPYNKDDYKKEYDPELVVDATPAVDNGPPIPPGHRRFFCETCRVVRKSLAKLFLD